MFENEVDVDASKFEELQKDYMKNASKSRTIIEVKSIFKDVSSVSSQLHSNSRSDNEGEHV